MTYSSLIMVVHSHLEKKIVQISVYFIILPVPPYLTVLSALE